MICNCTQSRKPPPTARVLRLHALLHTQTFSVADACIIDRYLLRSLNTQEMRPPT